MPQPQYVFFKGKVKWCRPHVPDPWGKYKTQLYPDDESLEKIRDLMVAQEGIQPIKNVLKKDEDGYFITISRDVQKEMRGKVVALGPVEVLDGNTPLPDGKGYAPLRNVNIGNGSDCIIKCELRTFNVPGGQVKGRSLRMTSIRVDNLVPFNKVEDYTELEQAKVKGMEDQAPRMW